MGGGDFCNSIPKFSGTQTVDGAPTEFAGITPLTFTFASSDYQSVAVSAADPTTTTTEATVRVAWDSTALRIHVHVEDALVAHSVGSSYDGDNVQIFVSSVPPSSGVQYTDYASQLTIVPQVSLPSATPAWFEEYGGGYTGTQPAWASRLVTGGYEVEMEWAWRGSVPTAGSQISFDLQVGVANTATGQRDYEYAIRLNPVGTGSLCGTPAPWCDTRHWCTPTLEN